MIKARVQCALESIKTNKATGHDSIPAKALKLRARELAVPQQSFATHASLAENGRMNGRKEYDHRYPRKTIRYTKRTTVP